MTGISLGWAVMLDGVVLSGGTLPSQTGTGFGEGPFGDTPFGGLPFWDDDVKGCLTSAPAGLGLPGLRTEDTSYPQRDGVRHFNDWYDARIITLADVIVKGDGACSDCVSARRKVHDILTAWGRRCEDAELVIFTDCHDPAAPASERVYSGPYGIKGRPRVAEVQWLGHRNTQHARLLLRFDGTDHKFFILDGSGTPGSGGECLTLQPDRSETVRCYDEFGKRCYDAEGKRCYPGTSGNSVPPTTTTNVGTECAELTITFHGTLTNPYIENMGTGERIDYNSTIMFNEDPVVVSTGDGTAKQGNVSRTHLLSGDIYMNFAPGENTIRLGSFGGTADTGYAEICYRPTTVMA